MTWYAKGFVNAADLRGKLAVIENLEQGLVLIDQAIERLNQQGWQLEVDEIPQLVEV
jgi:hypothetical protein